MPPADDAQAAVAAATAEASELETEQQKSKADLNRSIEELAKARATLGTLKSYGLGKHIDRTNRENHEALVKLSEIILANNQIVATVDGVIIKMNRAARMFSSCVVSNKLPRTTDRSAIKSMVDIDKYLVKVNLSKTEGDVSKEMPPIDPRVADVDDAYKLYAKAEVSGLIAERICPGAKINGAKLMELRRANVRDEDALATELKLKRVSIESEA